MRKIASVTALFRIDAISCMLKHVHTHMRCLRSRNSSTDRGEGERLSKNETRVREGKRRRKEEDEEEEQEVRQDGGSICYTYVSDVRDLSALAERAAIRAGREQFRDAAARLRIRAITLYLHGVRNVDSRYLCVFSRALTQRERGWKRARELRGIFVCGGLVREVALEAIKRLASRATGRMRSGRTFVRGIPKSELCGGVVRGVRACGYTSRNGDGATGNSRAYGSSSLSRTKCHALEITRSKFIS